MYRLKEILKKKCNFPPQLEVLGTLPDKKPVAHAGHTWTNKMDDYLTGIFIYKLKSNLSEKNQL